jgi:hypothetical protein
MYRSAKNDWLYFARVLFLHGLDSRGTLISPPSNRDVFVYESMNIFNCRLLNMPCAWQRGCHCSSVPSSASRPATIHPRSLGTFRVLDPGIMAAMEGFYQEIKTGLLIRVYNPSSYASSSSDPHSILPIGVLLTRIFFLWCAKVVGLKSCKRLMCCFGIL